MNERTSEIAAHRELVVPRAVPTGPYSWGVSVDLDGAVQESLRIPVDINYPVEIVAMHALVLNLGAEELQVPNVNEILCRFDVRHDLRATTQAMQGQVLPAGLAQAFVPLAALLHDVRLLGMRFPDRVSDVALQFRWARDVTAGAYENARLFVTFIVRPLGEGA